MNEEAKIALRHKLIDSPENKAFLAAIEAYDGTTESLQKIKDLEAAFLALPGFDVLQVSA
jgi:hypothetical protein